MMPARRRRTRRSFACGGELNEDAGETPAYPAVLRVRGELNEDAGETPAYPRRRRTRRSSACGGS